MKTILPIICAIFFIILNVKMAAQKKKKKTMNRQVFDEVDGSCKMEEPNKDFVVKNQNLKSATTEPSSSGFLQGEKLPINRSVNRPKTAPAQVEITTTTEEQQNMDIDLQNPQEIKKAIIISEIINRKY